MLFYVLFFWISLAILFYCYIGYGLLLFIFNCTASLFRRKKARVHAFQPPVTLVISAYNEEAILKNKIENTLQLDYPSRLLTTIFITDGSHDASMEIINEHPSFLLLHERERRGKLAAISRAMSFVKTPIVVFSDANSMLNRDSIRKIASHYEDPLTGGVAGEKKIVATRTSAVGKAEGLYWRYESFMKKQDAAFHTVVGAAGELFSIRTDLFKPPGDHIILDDFVISMNICLTGHRIEYEPGAFATEMPSASLEEERKRKIRISAGAYQSIGELKQALNFFKHPLLAFQYLSRRILRWVVCPLMLLLMFFSNLAIVWQHSSAGFYLYFLFAQLAFYLSALAGLLLMSRSKPAGIFTIPFYFLFMNWCLVKGFIRHVRRKQTVIWEKSARQVTH